VLKAITEQPVEPGLKAVNQLNQLLQDTLPAGVRDLFELKERAEVVVEPDEMKQYIQTHL
jgi:threonine synthase